MRRDEVIQFLQLVNYEEILPLDNGTDQFKEIAGYCRKRGLVTITPDNNCIISEKGLAMRTGEIKWDEFLPPTNNKIHLNGKSVKIAYRLAGAAVGCILLYQFVIKALLG